MNCVRDAIRSKRFVYLTWYAIRVHRVYRRTFSCLKSLKSYLRTSVGRECLARLSLLNIQSSVPIDVNYIIEKFVSNGVRGQKTKH